jgi:hypothetical protein
MGGRESLARRSFEIEDIDRFGRTGNHTIGSLRERLRKKRAGTRKQRTCGKELQKFAAILDAFGAQRYFSCESESDFGLGFCASKRI